MIYPHINVLKTLVGIICFLPQVLDHRNQYNKANFLLVILAVRAFGPDPKTA